MLFLKGVKGADSDRLGAAGRAFLRAARLRQVKILCGAQDVRTTLSSAP